jgi:hypothetical protein
MSRLVGYGVSQVPTNGMLGGMAYQDPINVNVNNISVGGGTLTGTASQPLQVTGGAYVSGNLGVGTTNPTVALDVIGGAKFTGVVTATSYRGDGSLLTGISTSGGISISTNTTNQAQFITYAISTGSTTGLGVSTTKLVFNPSSGNLGIGTTLPTSTLTVVGGSLITGITTVGLGTTSTPPSNSQLSFELTSDTNLRIKVRGSDGVLRSADITLT